MIPSLLAPETASVLDSGLPRPSEASSGSMSEQTLEIPPSEKTVETVRGLS